jgi:hypothetical protein
MFLRLKLGQAKMQQQKRFFVFSITYNHQGNQGRVARELRGRHVQAQPPSALLTGAANESSQRCHQPNQSQERAMESHSPDNDNRPSDFEDKLALLRKEIQCLPEEKRAELEQLADATERLHKQMRKATAQALGQLGNLQLGIKYLLFDLEATKRENEELRKTQSD